MKETNENLLSIGGRRARFVRFGFAVVLKYSTEILQVLPSGVGVKAIFENPVEITASAWKSKCITARCLITSHSKHDVEIVGVEVPCSCIVTNDIPTKVEAGSNTLPVPITQP